MTEPIKIGIVGLDTSHAIAFTQEIQGESPDPQLHGVMRIDKAMRFPSPFQSEPDQDKRQAQLQTMGVTMVPDITALLEGVDAVFLEINDPDLHLQYFEQVADCGKPIFLDKPMAGSLAEAQRIAELTAKHNARVWGASALRFIPKLADARNDIPKPLVAHIYGALGQAASQSDLVWYGCHTVEMLSSAMGVGARQVTASQDERGVVLTVLYPEGRRGVVECNYGLYKYGGRLQNEDAVRVFDSEGVSVYTPLLHAIRDWLVSDKPPITLREMLEVQAILDAGDRSLLSGKSEVVTL